MEALEEPATPPNPRTSETGVEAHSPRQSPAWPWLPVVPIGAYVVSRLMILAAAGLASSVKHGLTIGTALTSWDGGWYLRIAEGGYLPRGLPLILRATCGAGDAHLPDRCKSAR